MQEENKQAISCQQFELITESNVKINGLSNINEQLSTHYLIYRIDNLQNGKHYIGQHQTENPLDSYVGSGKFIKRAIAKEGIENFVKTILFDFDNFEEMNEKEKELVPLSACYPNDLMSYNLIEGGKAPIMYGENNPAFGKNPFRNKSKEWYDSYLKMMHDINTGKNNPRYGHSFFEKLSKEEFAAIKQKFSERSKGANNPQYGISPKERMDEITYKQWRDKISKASKGENNGCYGRKWMYNPITKDKVYPKKEDQQIYLNQGYLFGMGKK